MKNRKGKWTEEENMMLTKIVQEYTGRGETKIAAFKKASILLGRTTAACTHRWNTVLSKIENATSPTVTHQQQLPPPLATEPATIMKLDLNQVIDFLQQFQKNDQDMNLQEENKQLLAEQKHLKEKSETLKQKLENKKEEYHKFIQQYEAFTRILEETEGKISEHTIH